MLAYTEHMIKANMEIKVMNNPKYLAEISAHIAWDYIPSNMREDARIVLRGLAILCEVEGVSAKKILRAFSETAEVARKKFGRGFSPILPADVLNRLCKD